MEKIYKNIFFIIIYLFAIIILITSLIKNREEMREQRELIEVGGLCIGCEVDETIMDLGAEDVNITMNLSEVFDG